MIRFPLRTIVEFLKQKGALFRRICIQTIFSEDSFPNLTRVVAELKKATNVPISADCIPYNEVQIKRLYTIGLDRITINYELATPKLFSKIRGKERNGPYRWEDVTKSLANALRIFGPYRVASHLLVGIGETDLEALSHLQYLNDQRIVPSMLAFRPLRNTDLESIARISYPRYHTLQTAAYLIKNQIRDLCNMQFNKNGKLINFGLPKDLLLDIVRTGDPFVTHGCPGCNRPYYTIDPGQRHYTYPRFPTAEEIRVIENELLLYCSIHA
jgi:biotin synthase